MSQPHEPITEEPKKGRSLLRALMSHTAWRGRSLNLDLLDVLGNDSAEQKEMLARMLGAEAKRWQQLQDGNAALTFQELSGVLQAFGKAGHKIAPDKMKEKRSPFAQQAFFDFLRSRADAVQSLQGDLQRLRDEAKKERGFLKTAFNIFAHEKPLEKVMTDAAAFDRYCRKNGIAFDEGKQRLVAGEKPKTAWDTVKDLRFLLAAVGGGALGLAGVNLGDVPLLSQTPALFFGALPWLAAPFIGLNIFKSFSEHSILKESPTLLRFAAITAAGFLISMGVSAAMTSLIPPLDPQAIQAIAAPMGDSPSFSPMQYMLPIIGAFSAGALVYKRAKATVAGEFNAVVAKDGVAGKLSRVYNKTVGLAMNKSTAPLAVMAGKAGEKATAFINKAFPQFIDVAGLPAIATLMSATMATGGLGLVGMFAGYYLTAFTGLAVGGAALLGAYYAMGCRGKDFRELADAGMTGFSISSSSATMPKEKECLKNMGVSARTRNTVVPLGGVFNMYGTSLYMGLTAFYATAMFNAAPTPVDYLMTAGTVLAIALGAPGIPSSNITLLEPVLQQTGLAASQIQKIYAMVLPADRLLDMCQTALNVWGDMIAAVHPDRHKLRYERVKNIAKIRKEKEAGPKPA